MSGSFAELRIGHFHSGIDIKSSKGIIGDTIFSIQKGVISRLKIEPGGYGNSIYIDHPEGYTSVYAHLDSFNPKIDSIVKKHQYAQSQFTVDITAFNEPIKVNSGDYIALMGNSGKSFGPHLHFEVRETATDKLINPFLMGIKPTDNRSPTIKQIELKEYDSYNLPIESQLLSLENTTNSRAGKNYDLGAIQVNADNQYSLSLSLYDQMNGSSNKNGIYSIEWFENDTLLQEICLNDLEFEDSNGIYEIMDFQKKLKSNGVNYLFHLNRLHSFSFVKKRLNLFDNIANPSDKYKMIFSDFEGNQTSVNYQLVKLQSDSITLSPFLKPNFIITSKNQHIIRTKNFDILIPKQLNLPKQGIYIKEVNTIEDTLALILEPKDVSITNELTIRYKSESPRDHILNWVYTDDKGEKYVMATCPKNTVCQVTINKFRTVNLEVDSIAPSVSLIDHTLNSGELVKLKISDNYKPDNKNQYLDFDVFINNKWCLFNYDLKKDIIYSNVNNCFNKGNNTISVVVIDNAGNETCTDFKVIIK